MSTVNEKMTALANKIRSLSGQTDKLNLDEMDVELGAANTDKATMITTLTGFGVDIDSEASLSEVATSMGNINLDPVLQDKTVTPSTSQQTITADSGYDGLDTVTVNAMPTATQATPSISVSSSGLITATATQTAGYVAAGTKSGTKQLTTQAAKTITPSAVQQTAVASGRYTTGAVTVAKIPDSYVQPKATKGATTYTPTTSDQTISSGTYITGTQTIKGDANLVAGNIAEGVSIFGVTGTHSGGGGGGIETCTATINTSPDISVFGYGSYDMYITDYHDMLMGTCQMPSTDANGHLMIMTTKRVFNNVPVGSVFTMYTTDTKIEGVSIEGDVEFSYANHTTSTSNVFKFLVCRFNGTGTITVTS